MSDDLPRELLICGSGASEAIPALFCDCELCCPLGIEPGYDGMVLKLSRNH